MCRYIFMNVCLSLSLCIFSCMYATWVVNKCVWVNKFEATFVFMCVRFNLICFISLIQFVLLAGRYCIFYVIGHIVVFYLYVSFYLCMCRPMYICTGYICRIMMMMMMMMICPAFYAVIPLINIFYYYYYYLLCMFLAVCRSFGVALWELVTYGGLPYTDLSNDQVIQLVIGDGNVRLCQPEVPVSNLDRL